MKKAFYVLADIPSLTLYTNYNVFRTSSKGLSYLYLALDPIESLEVNVSKDDKSVLVWPDDSFKESAVDFIGNRETDIFEESYNKYYDKRWDDMPQIDMSLSDWEALQKKWDQLKKKKYQYLIFTLDDSGSLDKVDIVGKNELSDQDKKDMQQEHEKYLKYEKARQRYIANHPDYSEVWRGPQDDEYEADIMKYYDKDFK